MTVWTIGHSTLPIAEFIEFLKVYAITNLADVRTVPRSRHNPQFDRSNLPRSLADAGIAYTHHPGLGGLRHPKPDSINNAWRNTSFRGYADHMQSSEFRQSLEQLIEQAEQQRTAIMCAEAVHWRCHRSLIADALVIRGIAVEHILKAKTQAHRLTPFAHVEGIEITYDTQLQLPTNDSTEH